MKYLIRSLMTFLLLYGVAAALLVAAFFGNAGALTWVTGVALVIVAVQYLAGPALIRWFFDIDWGATLPARNHEFLESLCRRSGIPMPRIGIIHGPMPNAFTFGRIPSDASIVVTSGLLDSLSVEEANAVLAHEVGHIKHWDFLTMTIASIVPLLLYHLYALISRIKRDHAVTWAAYCAYLVSQFILLYLSRTREYWADQFAAEATGDANALSSGLVKICYGLAKLRREDAWASVHGTEDQKAMARQSALLAGKIGVMGISNAQPSLIVSGDSPDAALAVMRWDLVNPWARVYEAAATHPLTVHRLRALGQESGRQGRVPWLRIPEGLATEWGAFPLHFAVWAAPWVLGFTLYVGGRSGLEEDTALVLAGGLLAAWLLKIGFQYSGTFQPASIRELIEDTAVSQMSPRAVRIHGEIAGRAVPEAMWSPDLVIKDDTGFLFVNDRQSIPLARTLMTFKASNWTGRQVVLEGWYRRGLMPYIELSRITSDDGEPGPHRSYARWAQMAAAAAFTVLLYAIATN